MSKHLPNSLSKINKMADNLRSTMEEDDKKGKKGDVSTLNDVPYGNLQELYTDLLERYRKVSEEKDEIANDAKTRQESYLRKELDYRQRLGQLEERIQTIHSDDSKGDVQMSHIRTMHGEIQDTITKIQGKTSKILKAQERDLIRAFRARLADVTDELEKEQKKNHSGSVEWVQRCQKLTEELEWLKDLTEKLTAENKNYLKENRRFKRQLKTQEEDREFLIKQLVAVKKENARLRYSYEQATLGGQAAAAGGSGGGDNMPEINSPSRKRDPMSRTFDGGSRPGSAASGRKRMDSAPSGQMGGGMGSMGGSGGAASEERYRNMLVKLKKQLDEERKQVRLIRTHYTNEVAQRTELQNFLKKCIEDVRQDISERHKQRRAALRASGNRLARNAMPKKPDIDPRDIPLEDFTPADRINVMEWLLSQDHVIYMLYDNMFPRKTTSQGGEVFDNGLLGGAAGGGEDNDEDYLNQEGDF